MKSIKWEYSRETFDGYTQKTEEILDFANMVFSMAYSSTDFAALLPKAYSSERCGIPIHHMIREENKIRALIDIYPIVMRLNNKNTSSIKAAYVGTVAVHPNARGRGYMIELMKRAEQDARRQGCALMILDGERHRYQHYGFEHAGISYSFCVETGNIRHCCAGLSKEADISSAYRFEELAVHSPHLDSLYQLYQRRLVTARSREDFWLCLQSYNASVYAVLQHDEPVGYVSLSEDKEAILEIELANIGDLCKVLHDFMIEFGVEQLRISVGMDERDKIRELEKVCDSCNASMSHQIKILDYEVVLAFLLNWKQRYDTLAIGDYVLGIENCQTGNVENYQMSVAADRIDVFRTDRTADTVLGELELVRVLTTTLCFVEGDKIKNAPVGWFPLPFYLPEADTF